MSKCRDISDRTSSISGLRETMGKVTAQVWHILGIPHTTSWGGHL